MKNPFLLSVLLIVSCKHAAKDTSTTSGIVESSPRTGADSKAPWEIAKTGVDYWWADDHKVYAITCNPELDKASDNQVGEFSTVESCKQKFAETVRSMPIEDFKAKTLKFIAEQSEVGDSFKWRRIIDKYKGKTLDSSSDQAEVKALSEALSEEKKRNVTSMGDPNLFLSDLVERLQRNPSSEIEEAKDPEVSKGYDKYMRKWLLKVTVGRYIPDAALAKGYHGVCKARKTIPERNLPSQVVRGDFYREERDYTFLLVGPEDTCAKYGFKTAEYLTAQSDELAKKLINDFAANTDIPSDKDTSKVFGGGKLIKMNYFKRQGFAAFQVKGQNLGFLSKFHESLPSSYRATDTLCQREELQFTNWNPCP